jgi:hypothetical protein
VNAIHAVLGFLGALLSGRGCRLYRRFSLVLAVDVVIERLSRAALEREAGPLAVGSASGSDSDWGMPRYVAMARWRARRWPSLKRMLVRSSSVMSTTVSQSWKPLATRTSTYTAKSSRSSTSVKTGMSIWSVETTDHGYMYDANMPSMGMRAYLKRQLTTPSTAMLHPLGGRSLARQGRAGENRPTQLMPSIASGLM